MKKNVDTQSEQECPISGIQQIIRGKWTVIILYYLSQGTLRFGELSRRIPMITQANLTRELKALESCGMIHREVFHEVPPRVEYSLTDVGKDFLPIIRDLEEFTRCYQEKCGEDEKDD
jgi:DNA-binding HxlR family transcriptional regulator